MKRFEERVVMITGAGSGIGQATALRLASEGASVFCVDLDLPAADATAASVVAEGGKALAHHCNVADEAQVNDCIAACIAEYGSLYCLVHMAGLLRFERTHEMEKSSWQQIIDVNLTGTFLICKAALPHLVTSQGNIVNAASTAALAGLPWGAAYSASKGGVLAMTRSLAVEYGNLGLRANAICPGSIDTAMTNADMIPKDVDMKLLYRIMPLDTARGPESVASVIAMLASDDGAHINGETIRVDGGTLA